MVKSEGQEEDRKILERVLRVSESDPELQVTGVESAPACGVGDNFMSAVSRLVVSVETVKRYSTKKCFLMKRQLASQERRDIFRCDPAFRNEADAYQIVVPALEEFANTKLPFPECIHASSDCLILDDLKQSGFKMADRRKGLNFLQASLAVKELGKFHGTSLGMKSKQPRRFNRIKTSIQEFVFVPASAPMFGVVLENSLNLALCGLKMHGNCEERGISHIVDKLEAMRDSLFQKMFEIVCPKEPLAVICHGDFYINNMLFRDNEMNIPEEVCMVDLQACRYSSPATDILYFFASSLEEGLLASHHETLFQIYHSAFCAELSRTAPNSKQVTLDEIIEEVKKNALFGLIMGFVLLTAVTAKPGAIDTDRESLPTLEESLKFLSPEYFDRVLDLVITFHKLGYV